MNFNDLYPSSFLKSDDIGNLTPTVTIESLTIEEMADGTKKPALSFVGKDKKMVLNKTNGAMIAHLYGNETDHWQGKQIMLVVEPVQGPQGLTKGLRVKPPAQNNQAQQMPAPQHDAELQNEKIPF